MADLALALTTADATSQTPSFDPAFTDEDAQIILRSSDNMQYRMHTVVLRTTSGFFRDMLALPRAVGSQVAAQQSESIVLDETSEVLGKLFRMISGLKYGDFSFDMFQGILKAAYKYDMEGTVDTLRRFTTLPDFLSQPLEIYALAAQYGWEREAKAASKLTLALPIHLKEYETVLETIPSRYLLRLLKLHRERKTAFQRTAFESVLGGRRAKFFGLEKCDCRAWSSKGREFEKSGGMWTLAYSMLNSMDRRVDGGELLEGAWRGWQSNESICQDCNRTTKDYESRIASWVKGCIASLPSTI